MPGTLLGCGAADPDRKRHVDRPVSDAHAGVGQSAPDQRAKRWDRVFPEPRGFHPACVAEQVHGVLRVLDLEGGGEEALP